VVEKAKTSRWSASGPNREMMVFVDDRGYPERAEPVFCAGRPSRSVGPAGAETARLNGRPDPTRSTDLGWLSLG